MIEPAHARSLTRQLATGHRRIFGMEFVLVFFFNFTEGAKSIP